MFILASSSPRRIKLGKLFFKNFKVIDSKFNERKIKISKRNYSQKLSYEKALTVQKKYKDALILACDTIVLFKNKIINKPINRKEAKNILYTLSNKTHYVITGYAILFKNQKILGEECTKVKFNKLSNELINQYVDNGYSDGKAGAYGIQDNFPLVKKIIGSYYNVIGLPIEKLSVLLKPYGVLKSNVKKY